MLHFLQKPNRFLTFPLWVSSMCQKPCPAPTTSCPINSVCFVCGLHIFLNPFLLYKMIKISAEYMDNITKNWTDYFFQQWINWPKHLWYAILIKKQTNKKVQKDNTHCFNSILIIISGHTSFSHHSSVQSLPFTVLWTYYLISLNFICTIRVIMISCSQYHL